MNDPNKAIDVNLSSLLSLKAELLRKQAEVSKTKATRIAPNEYISNKSSNYNLVDSTVNKKDKKGRVKGTNKSENAKVLEHEDTLLLEKSRRVLEAKSKYYERMSRSGGKLNSDDNSLVLFNRKQQEERPEETLKNDKFNISSDSDSSYNEGDDDDGDNDNDNADADAEDDWVEYTDCLGRTRKCLRKDLESAKKRDAELAASMPERIDQNKANWVLDERAKNKEDEDDLPIGPLPTESIISDGCSIISKLDEQRANWERKEIENLDKTDVHYQDVFFDEARQHGVAYYAFSTDEEERHKQQKELEDAREKTLAEQKQRDALRAQREKVIAERVLAAKNRQRARLGLPPLEKDETEELKPVEKETKKERKERKRMEKLKRKQEKIEKERELDREKHVRPWDYDKDGVRKTVENPVEQEWQYKAERVPMSQEEWNTLKRSERNPNFAPVSEAFDNTKPKRTNFSNMHPPNMPSTVNDDTLMPPPAVNTFSSVQCSKKQFQRRNYECSSYDEERDPSRSGVAIPPPANLDYSLPPLAKRSKTNVDLERSIEAGLRFLRDSCDKETITTKSSWTAKADY